MDHNIFGDYGKENSTVSKTYNVDKVKKKFSKNKNYKLNDYTTNKKFKMQTFLHDGGFYVSVALFYEGTDFKRYLPSQTFKNDLLENALEMHYSKLNYMEEHDELGDIRDA